MFDLVLFGLPARFSPSLTFLLLGTVRPKGDSQQEQSPQLLSFCRKTRRCEMGIKPFSQRSRIKVEPKEMPALLIDFSRAPLRPAVREGHICKKPVHQTRISRAGVFLAAGSRRTPSLLGFIIIFLWLQTALQRPGEAGVPHTLRQPRACKSFTLSQQSAAVTQNRSSKWGTSPPGVLLTYSPRTWGKEGGGQERWGGTLDQGGER